MKNIAFCAAAAATASLICAQPAAAAVPTARTCQPTFQPVAGLAEAIDFSVAAFGRPLIPDELEMLSRVVSDGDRNGDGTICVKIAAQSPGLPTPVLQAVDNQLPVH